MRALRLGSGLAAIFASALAIGAQGVPSVGGSNIVSLPVTVVDRQGRSVVGLEKADFRVVENGKEQRVEFLRIIEEPVTVMLVLDTSGSMEQYLGQLAEAATSFIRQLRPDDQVIIAQFGQDFEVILPKTRVGGADLEVRIREKKGQKTYVYDAVDDALKRMARMSGRRAIVLFTDALSENGGANIEKNFRDAEEQDALIYTVRFGDIATHRPDWRPPGSRWNYEWMPVYDEANSGKIVSAQDLSNMGTGRLSPKQYAEETKRIAGYMDGLAYRTGARSFHIRDIADLDGSFREVARELREQYSLGYNSTVALKTGERRKIKVTVNIPDLAVRSRKEVVYTKK